MNGARIFLGVSGGIAAYKAASLTSALVQGGAIVDVVLTAEAERFVTALTFSALTARPVYCSLWDAPHEIPHIRLVRAADCAVVAPATANLVAKLAHGIADDLLTTALLAARIPLIVAPAMNSAMYEHRATQENLQTLRERGVEIVEPEIGFLAERESGVGRLASEERLLEAISRTLARTQSLEGLRVGITAGPTREPLDPVRFLSNPSTGEMGIELAREAALRGADVQLILGPTTLQPPGGVHVTRVHTAQEMHDRALEQLVGCEIIIACAAVSDFRAHDIQEHKVKKSDADLVVRFERTPDVLKALAERKGRSFLVGFAAETQNHLEYATEKLRAKHLDAIAVNDVSGTAGFGPGRNRLQVLFADESAVDLGHHPKAQLAAALLDAITPRVKGRTLAARD